MNRKLTHGNQQHDSSLTLFVSGEAPSSHRAHRNLTAALEARGLDKTPVRQIDVLHEPQQAIRCGVFAAPALMLIGTSGHRRLLYGDLSDADSLRDFLSTI